MTDRFQKALKSFPEKDNQGITYGNDIMLFFAHNIEIVKEALTIASRSQWCMDMTKAPRDGTVYLSYSSDGVLETAWEQVDGGGHPENGPPVFWYVSPHHNFEDKPNAWMPLPEAPLEEKNDGL